MLDAALASLWQEVAGASVSYAVQARVDTRVRSMEAQATGTDVPPVAGDMDLVRVDILADPGAMLTSHAIEVRGSGGQYRFGIENFPDPANPATSSLTARSMVSGSLRLAGRGPHFI